MTALIVILVVILGGLGQRFFNMSNPGAALFGIIALLLICYCVGEHGLLGILELLLIVLGLVGCVFFGAYIDGYFKEDHTKNKKK